MELGSKLAKALEPGAIILLEGELGAGKTVLTKGICLGLGVDKSVPARSPTFTLVNEYPGPVPVRHADLYRVSGVEDLETIGLFDGHMNGVVIIEWADRLDDEVEWTIKVKITDVSENERLFEITASRNALEVAGFLVESGNG